MLAAPEVLAVTFACTYLLFGKRIHSLAVFGERASTMHRNKIAPARIPGAEPLRGLFIKGMEAPLQAGSPVSSHRRAR